MSVLVDTTVWSLALRRPQDKLSEDERNIRDGLALLVRDHLAVIIGPIRQEVLSGVREQGIFDSLRQRLRSFDDDPLTTDDFEEAAQGFNRCAARGISGSVIDFLICAVALRRGMELFTLDRDFERYATVLPLRLHVPRTSSTLGVVHGPRPRRRPRVRPR